MVSNICEFEFGIGLSASILVTVYYSYAFLASTCKSNGKISLSKHRRLIAELEALGERGDALRSLNYMREIAAHDSTKLGLLEQMLGYL
ncbi:hypothetical protein Tco_0150366 [Tanacetum coccineum]